MKRLILMILFCFIFTSAPAVDFKIPTFSDGEIVSADKLNEAFAAVVNISKIKSASELVGQWECVKFTNAHKSIGINPAYVKTDAADIFRALTFPLIINDGGDGTLLWQSTDFHPFQYPWKDSQTGTDKYYDDCSASGYISIFNGYWGVSSSTDCTGGGGPNAISLNYSARKIIKKTETKILISGDGVSIYGAPALICEKQDTIPNAPTELSYSLNGLSVALAWIDNSDDENGFTVYRKGMIDGDWKRVAETGADLTSYIDNIDTGEFWYRIKAINDYGESAGSNVIYIEIL